MSFMCENVSNCQVCAESNRGDTNAIEFACMDHIDGRVVMSFQPKIGQDDR